jgi:hypothetical protein
MSDSEVRARKERRRLIERLNDTQQLIGPHILAQRGQMGEEELAAEIEKKRGLGTLLPAL